MSPLLFLLCLVPDQRESKLPLKPGWMARAELKSEFATQAAAAEDRFVYAVSSEAVAKYERSTGKLVGVSKGKAKHLNSAFLWKGKLYCAHSNYPSKPEESDIQVFDPQTLQLTTFHTFEKPPGSLTWCLPDDQHWWCCFAHYQKDNAKTVLLKMDHRFRELARWTFPKVVVQDWDGMSASGGLWDGDDLLVIGHHFRAIYRLRLPRKGTVLEFVEALRCPFPGQGIAHDPKTGGLVGIDRRKRLVVFAERAK